MDAMPSEFGGIGAPPPVGQLPNYKQYVILDLNTQFFMEDEMIDLYEIAESNDDWIHSIEGVEEVFDPETQKLLAQF